MAQKNEIRRKDTKSVDWEKQEWCENKVAYICHLYLFGGDPQEDQAKVSIPCHQLGYKTTEMNQ